jgi:hypothetical protein
MRTKIVCLMSLIMGIWTTAGLSATIKGVVNDTMTKAPVDSVLVQLKGTSIKTYTDAAGKFTLNTATGILRQTPVLNNPRLRFSGASVIVYSADGSLILKKDHIDDPTMLFFGMPDGIYLVQVHQGGQLYSGRLLKMGNCFRVIGAEMGTGMAPVTESMNKVAATVTLVYSHKFYTGKEAAATEGDTSVTTKLRMWWPDATNTGVLGCYDSSLGRNLRYSDLTPVNSSQLGKGVGGSIDVDNTVIDKKDITGSIRVVANHVTIKRCRIVGDGYGGVAQAYTGTPGVTGLVVQDCEISGNGTNVLESGVYEGSSNPGITVLRCNISVINAGIHIAGNSFVQDNYIHDLDNSPGSHCTCIGAGNGPNTVLRHNTCKLQFPSSGAMANYTEFGAVDGFAIDNNWIDGGSYGLTLFLSTNYPTLKNVHVHNNTFARTFNRMCGSYGPVAWSTYTSQPGNTWTYNVWGPWTSNCVAGDPLMNDPVPHP